MDILLSIVVGLLYAAGFYMLLNKGMTKMIIGIMILGYASNLFIFIIARLTRGFPALIKSDNSLSERQVSSSFFERLSTR